MVPELVRPGANIPGHVAEPDESLYSRQIYTIGIEAMRKMTRASVLIIGLRGVGVEIAKNIVLAGVKSVTLFDPENVTVSDLASQFFLSEDCIGSRRDEACVHKLAELNPYVRVHVLQCPVSGNQHAAKYINELSAEIRTQVFSVVVCTSAAVQDMMAINNVARAAGASFVAADARGLAAFGFCDFGEQFSVLDATGENLRSGMVAAISHDSEGLVTCLDDVRHGLEDGDYVRFSEVVGLNGINEESTPFKVSVLGPYTFSIGDTSKYQGAYVSGGVFTEVHVPFTVSFKTLEESLPNPECVITDFSKIEVAPQLHVAFNALSSYLKDSNGRLPQPQNQSDAANFLHHAKKFATQIMNPQVELNEDLIKKFALQCAGDLCPVAAVIGGLMAQEVLKACSGKLQPLKQYFYYDAFEAHPCNLFAEAGAAALAEQNFAPKGTRYDGQVAVFGRQLQSFIESSRLFLVGAGAIGCEMLKNWAMMGVSTGVNGKIVVTDMDTIEKSNLNRQFLFRPHDVGSLKSTTAAAAIKKMNSGVKVDAFSDRVGTETENVFNSDFWEQQDAIANALDNVEARRYVDRRCVFFRRALFESGTLGVKGNMQVVIPHLTESYSSSQDPPETTVPMCTLKNFPNQIEHTIQWARDTFEGLFVQNIAHAQNYLTNPSYVDDLMQNSENTVEGLQAIKETLLTGKPQTFECCVAWARYKFESLFVNNIKQLLHNFPKDSRTATGTLFWTAPKRAPTPIEFDETNPAHMDFIVYAALLRAANYGITETSQGSVSGPLPSRKQEEYYRGVLTMVNPPKFEPQSNVVIHANDDEARAAKARASARQTSSECDIKLEDYIQGLPQVGSMAASPEKTGLYPAVFEKDDDSNFHIDVISATSNIRAASYGIAPADRFKTKQIAGKIIPAIATTTAVVTGLACIEMYKYFQDLMLAREQQAGVGMSSWQPKIERYRNSFLSLAGPMFAGSEPMPAPKMKYNNTEFTLWDRIEYDDIPIGEIIEDFNAKHGIEIGMMSCGVTMVYAMFMQRQKATERKKQTVSEAMEVVTKAPLGDHVTELVVEACCSDENGDDVEIPYILIRRRPRRV